MFYDRKIKYLDYYEDGTRVRGGGFVKLEARGTELRVEVVVSGLYPKDSFTRNVVLHGRKQEHIVGEIVILNGKGQFRQLCQNLENIAGTGIGYDELQGIHISLGAGRELSCSWPAQGMAAEGEKRRSKMGEAEGAGNRNGSNGMEGAGNRNGSNGMEGAGRRNGSNGMVQESHRNGMNGVERESRMNGVEWENRENGVNEAEWESRGDGMSEAEWENRGDGMNEVEWGSHRNGTSVENQENYKNEINISGGTGRENVMGTVEWVSRQNTVNMVEEGSRGGMSGEKDESGRGMSRGNGEVHQGAMGMTERSDRKTSMSTDGGAKGGWEKSREVQFAVDSQQENGGKMNGRWEMVQEASGIGTEKRSIIQKAEISDETQEKRNRRGEDAKGGTGNSGREVKEKSWKESEKPQATFGKKQAETGKPVKLLEDKWMQLCAIYPHIHPFRDKREYLSIGPADFVLFPAASYKLVNNSFLLHGYYNYHHLILTRLEQKGEYRYYIGVPGSYFEKEKQVAIMFGFESFECEAEPAQIGDFGYYMMRTEL